MMAVFRKKRYLLLLPVFFLPPATSEIYRWQDSQGGWHYSDKAGAAAESVDLPGSPSLYRVDKVLDGDTLVLEGNRRVRLAGINAPEIAHGRAPAEPGGDEAAAMLEKKLAGSRVYLRQARSRRDRYQRLLGYVFLQDGTFVNEWLLAQGLAVLTLYPPDLARAAVLEAAQKAAMLAGRGIWQRAEYAPVTTQQLVSFGSGGYRGWQRLIFRPLTIRRTSRGSVYLEDDSTVSLRIPAESQAYFPDPEQFVGKTLEVHGWVSRRQSRYTVLVRHPSAIHPEPLAP